MVFRKNSICFVTLSNGLAQAPVSSSGKQRGLQTCPSLTAGTGSSTCRLALSRSAEECLLKRCRVTFLEIVSLHAPETLKIKPRNRAVPVLSPLITATLLARNVARLDTSHRWNL